MFIAQIIKGNENKDERNVCSRYYYPLLQSGGDGCRAEDLENEEPVTNLSKAVRYVGFSLVMLGK